MDPILSLAMTLHSCKGCYAVLLGSGASRSAEIPTGWEVILDLIRKLAQLEGVDCDPDPAAWFTKKFGKEPDYSELLNELAKSPAERNQLMRQYFEPTEDEREQGKKMPTPAHRALAQLVKNGFIRAIITTNFDHLIEVALSEIGVNPDVIFTPDAAEGALPLVHSKCTVIKVHGDYLDMRFKNTLAELEQYDPRIDRLLDQVFDEFGLIVCGWSGVWDIALRRAIQRTKGRRFSTYWVAKGRLETAAQALVQLRSASVIQSPGADEFFVDVANKVQSLEDISRPHPISAKVAVATLKRYLTNEESRIRLEDLVREETEVAYKTLMNPEFLAKPESEISLHQKFRIYDNRMEIPVALMAHGCRWGMAQHTGLWKRVLERFGNAELVTQEMGFTAEPDLRLYPAILLLYSGGIASVMAGKFETLNALIYEAQSRRPNDVRSPVSRSCMRSDLGIRSAVFNLTNSLTRIPLSHYLHRILRETFQAFEPDDHAYDMAFDQFECFLCLALGDIQAGNADSPLQTRTQPIRPTELDCPLPVGRLGLSRSQHTDVLSLLCEDQRRDGTNWPPFNAGFLGGNVQRFDALSKSLSTKRNAGWTP